MRAKNDTQSLFHGDPTIWVITTLDPRAEGKTHIGKDGTSQVIDVIFEEKEKMEKKKIKKCMEIYHLSLNQTM